MDTAELDHYFLKPDTLHTPIMETLLKSQDLSKILLYRQESRVNSTYLEMLYMSARDNLLDFDKHFRDFYNQYKQKLDEAYLISND